MGVFVRLTTRVIARLTEPSRRLACAAALLGAAAWVSPVVVADVVGIEVQSREKIEETGVDFSYEAITGVVSFTLDPNASANTKVTDLGNAPLNAQGLVEYPPISNSLCLRRISRATRCFITSTIAAAVASLLRPG